MYCVAARGRFRVHTFPQKYARARKSMHGGNAKWRLRLQLLLALDRVVCHTSEPEITSGGPYSNAYFRAYFLHTLLLLPYRILLPTELKVEQRTLHTLHTFPPLRVAAVEVAVAMLW